MSSTKFRTAKWLDKHGFAPHLYMFRHLERGQVIYSQLPRFTNSQIEKVFKEPNWQNRKPSTRRDLWKVMCVVNTGDYAQSVQLYQDLVRLRYLRDVLYKKENDTMRKAVKSNEFGQVWYSGQYRPVYSQESVADLKECLSKIPSANRKVTLYWEDPWRKGDESAHWDQLTGVKHELIPKDANTSREESAILKELSLKSLKEYTERL